MNLPVLPTRTEPTEDATLRAQGWERRFVAAPPRLAEMVQLYTDLGHEVHLAPISPTELDDECDGCWLALSLFRTLYTRRPT